MSELNGSSSKEVVNNKHVDTALHNDILGKRNSISSPDFVKITKKDKNNNILYQYKAKGDNQSISQAKTSLASKISKLTGCVISPYQIMIYRSASDSQLGKEWSGIAPKVGENIVIGLFIKKDGINGKLDSRENINKNELQVNVISGSHGVDKLVVKNNNGKIIYQDNDFSTIDLGFKKWGNMVVISNYDVGGNNVKYYTGIDCIVKENGEIIKNAIGFFGNYIVGRDNNGVFVMNKNGEKIKTNMKYILAPEQSQTISNMNAVIFMDHGFNKFKFDQVSAKFISIESKKDTTFNRDTIGNEITEIDQNYIKFFGKKVNKNDIKEIIYGAGEGSEGIVRLKSGKNIYSSSGIEKMDRSGFQKNQYSILNGVFKYNNKRVLISSHENSQRSERIIKFL